VLGGGKCMTRQTRGKMGEEVICIEEGLLERTGQKGVGG
jgi:hypothetical protein